MYVKSGLIFFYLPSSFDTIVLTLSLQAEISAFENANSVPASDYAGGTLYTTLSPCDICTGAAIFFRVSRVVIGESETYYGGNDYLRSKGIQVDDLASTECRDMVGKYIKEHPEVW